MRVPRRCMPVPFALLPQYRTSMDTRRPALRAMHADRRGGTHGEWARIVALQARQ
jgi:hypothetical protein